MVYLLGIISLQGNLMHLHLEGEFSHRLLYVIRKSKLLHTVASKVNESISSQKYRIACQFSLFLRYDLQIMYHPVERSNFQESYREVLFSPSFPLQTCISHLLFAPLLSFSHPNRDFAVTRFELGWLYFRYIFKRTWIDLSQLVYPLPLEIIFLAQWWTYENIELFIFEETLAEGFWKRKFPLTSMGDTYKEVLSHTLNMN